MTLDEKKKRVAEAAVEHVANAIVIGIGTGSTTDHFIDALAHQKGRIEGTVSSSERSTERLKSHGIEVLALNSVIDVELYVDGADEANHHRHLIKGAGGALTKEKVVAAAAKRFICIVDDSKLVDRLGTVPLPIEVIPMARSFVAREITRLGGQPRWREGFATDNGNEILDVHHFDIADPIGLERALDQIPGIVTNGLFARRGADTLLVGADDGVRVIG